FLAVVAGSLRVGGPLGVAGAFVAYAVGMGVVVLAVALAVAVASERAVGALRHAGAVLARAGGALLVVAGAYVAWYGWVEIRSLSGGTAADPVVGAAIEVQAAVADLVAGLGAGGLLLIAAMLAIGFGARRVLRRRSAAPPPRTTR
ncbi:MAG: hypothetical protein L0I24_13795, partial [Pseudonocardia sp.]|nr:hypothetical protein [Pseudonocardia sp.]